MSAQDYPVTQGYGYDPSYPLNNGFHNGIDYGAPEDTPVVVNGVTIGLTGATGYAIGPHLHVGRWIGGQVTDPGIGNGFRFNDAQVTEINEDPTNGKYVRVQGDGASWVYLHMSDNQLVTVGQVLQGEDMKPQRNQIILAYKLAFGPDHPPTEEQITAQLNQPDLSHVLISIEGDSAKAWATAGGDATKKLNEIKEIVS